MFLESEPLFFTTNREKFIKCKSLLNKKNIHFEEREMKGSGYNQSTYCIYIKGFTKIRAKKIIDQFNNEN